MLGEPKQDTSLIRQIVEGEQMTIRVERSELEKILDALTAARDFFVARDTMNGAVNLAAHVRWSPLTSTCDAEVQRLSILISSES